MFFNLRFDDIVLFWVLTKFNIHTTYYLITNGLKVLIMVKFFII